MKIITPIEEMKKWSRLTRSKDKTIGFVATMGCLHKGHLSLIKTSIAKCDTTVVSIFVNPIQFSPNEDFNSYPRCIESDKQILQTTGIDVLFNPNQKDLYPEKLITYDHKNWHLRSSSGTQPKKIDFSEIRDEIPNIPDNIGGVEDI